MQAGDWLWLLLKETKEENETFALHHQEILQEGYLNQI